MEKNVHGQCHHLGKYGATAPQLSHASQATMVAPVMTYARYRDLWIQSGFGQQRRDVIWGI
jgi:hypothetical protein